MFGPCELYTCGFAYLTMTKYGLLRLVCDCFNALDSRRHVQFGSRRIASSSYACLLSFATSADRSPRTGLRIVLLCYREILVVVWPSTLAAISVLIGRSYIWNNSIDQDFDRSTAIFCYLSVIWKLFARYSGTHLQAYRTAVIWSIFLIRACWWVAG